MGLVARLEGQHICIKQGCRKWDCQDLRGNILLGYQVCGAQGQGLLRRVAKQLALKCGDFYWNAFPEGASGTGTAYTGGAETLGHHLTAKGKKKIGKGEHVDVFSLHYRELESKPV